MSQHESSGTAAPPGLALAKVPTEALSGGADVTPESDSSHADAAPREGKPNDVPVDWDGPDDPENPRNWPFRRKWGATAIVSAFTFISPVSSSMVAPAATQVAEDLGIRGSTEIAMVISVFILAYAIGPLFLAPISELYGRARVLQGANMFFLAWNIGCGFAQTKSQLIAFRFLAGLGGSAPLAIGGGVLADLFDPNSRGMAFSIYSLGPLLGPAVGPVAGGWIAERSTWRWVFWSTSITDGFIQLMGFLYLQETYPPVLLERKAKRIMKSMDPEKRGSANVQTANHSENRHWKTLFAKALIRPFTLFAFEPILQILGLYLALIYGIMYILLTTIPTIFLETYHESVGIGGLHYLAISIGTMIAAQTNGPILDRTYKYYTKKNGGIEQPEYRLSASSMLCTYHLIRGSRIRTATLFFGSFLLPAGMLLIGWCAQNHVHWIAVDFGLAFVGAGSIVNMIACQTYVIDAFTVHAASALAAVSCLRSFAGFGFPLFAPAMYKALGYGKGDTILAVIAAAIGCPAPWILWFYGERIRGMSRHARKAVKAVG